MRAAWSHSLSKPRGCRLAQDTSLGRQINSTLARTCRTRVLSRLDQAAPGAAPPRSSSYSVFGKMWRHRPAAQEIFVRLGGGLCADAPSTCPTKKG